MQKLTTAQSFYRQLYRIRFFEQTVLDNFARGVFHGTTHTYLGQEANAVGVLTCLDPEDIVVSNHRCHGHFLVYGGDMRQLFGELMGKSSGVCGGRGGSQHLHWRNFYSNGIQGGMLPAAVGMALAEKHKHNGSLVVAFLGDGTLGEGILYEALNIATLWQAPILFVLENNRIAQSTPIELSVAGDMAARFTAFGIPVNSAEGADVLSIQAAAQISLQNVRSQSSPQALILHTQRLGPHSKGDDTRPAVLLAYLQKEHDPLIIHAARISAQEREVIEKEVRKEVQAAFQQALADPVAEEVELTR